VLRARHSLDPVAVDRVAGMVTAPQVRELLLLSRRGPEDGDGGMLAVDGHLDRAQTMRITPLSYVCATLTEALRHHTSGNWGGDSGEILPPPSIALAFFCGLHTAEDDDLRGPRGLVRCLTAQLVVELAQNEWITEQEPIALACLREDDMDDAGQLPRLEIVCQLFHALLRLVPRGVSIFCIVDGFSSYEREELRGDFELVFDAFCSMVADPKLGTAFRLLLTSPTASRWLPDCLPSTRRLSLRRAASRTSGVAGRGITGLTRAASMPEVGSFGGASQSVGRQYVEKDSNDCLDGEYDRRTSE
jgi:hypothetical protein